MATINWDHSKKAEALRSVPNKPGVYLFKDKAGKVLYVGKALSLRKRLQSYFRKSSNLTARIETMLEKMTSLDFYTTDTELEAIFLECNLIKEHRPDFNVSYRDDKSFPYLAVTVSDEYPRFYVTRETHHKGTKYYGPFTKAWAVRETLDTLRRVFPVCTCSSGKFRRLRATRSACLDYHIRKCAGPCIDAVSRDEYRALVKGATDFLEGKTDKIMRKLRREMEEAAQAQEFERAGVIRNRLVAAEAVLERQKIVSNKKVNEDIVGLAVEGDSGSAQIFQVRHGKLLGSQNFLISTGAEGDFGAIGEQGSLKTLTPDEAARRNILSSFLTRYYATASLIPPIVLIPEALGGEQEALEEWLTLAQERKVRLLVPQRGRRKELLDLAQKNAAQALALQKTKQPEAERVVRELIELQRELDLTEPPARIEAYDISNTGGREAVGSLVVLENGRPKKDDYRRFTIRGISEQDDYAMMKQVVKRRFSRKPSGDEKFGGRPDLILIDGGKGHLTAALQALAELGLGDIRIIALAKGEEELYLPGRRHAQSWPKTSGALNILRRVRDEAHRFAVSHHRGRRSRAMVSSPLDSVPGIGPKRKEQLLRGLGSKKVVEATLNDLRELLPEPLAERVFARFHPDDS